MGALRNGWRRWSKWSLPTRLGLLLGGMGVPALIISAAAWYWPDFWKRTSHEQTHTANKPVAQGSEWREAKPKESFIFARVDFADAQTTVLTSINNAGDIVGIYEMPGIRQSFIRHQDGSFTPFDFPKTKDVTTATGINNTGEVIGFYYDNRKGCNGNPAHGFVRNKDGSFISFTYPGAHQTYPNGINDKKEVVGSYFDCDGLTRGFILRPDGTFSPLDYPDAASTIPMGINNSEEITGYWRDPKFGDRGFLRKVDGTFITIMPDPSTYARPKSINSRGDIVGDSGLGTFLRLNDGTLSPIDDHPPACSGLCATVNGINEKLILVGQYQLTSNVHGFLATPKPK